MDTALAIMTESAEEASVERKRHNKWLVLIALYKLGQGLVIAAIGVGALRLLHKDVSDVLSDLATALRFNPESRLINFILVKASLIDDPMLRRIGAVAFSYAGLSLAESIGLYLEKAWAEYLTLFVTGSFLPWEMWEVFSHITWVRVALLVVNALVFLYLLKIVVERRQLQKAAEKA